MQYRRHSYIVVLVFGFILQSGWAMSSGIAATTDWTQMSHQEQVDFVLAALRNGVPVGEVISSYSNTTEENFREKQISLLRGEKR